MNWLTPTKGVIQISNSLFELNPNKTGIISGYVKFGDSVCFISFDPVKQKIIPKKKKDFFFIFFL
jgi:hypothetical protein